jgi:hypothetical protein
MTALFPKMAHNTAQPLLDRLVNDNQCRSEDDVRELVAACRLVGAMFDQVWALIQEILHRGVESGQLQAIIAGFPELVEQISTVAYLKVRTKTASAALPAEERQTYLQALDDLGARADVLRQKLASLTRLLASPPPQIALDSIHKQADYEDMEQILERLKAGADL